MKALVAYILASAARKMWSDNANLGRYTAETAEREPNLTSHYLTELKAWFSWLDFDSDVKGSPIRATPLRTKAAERLLRSCRLRTIECGATDALADIFS